MSAVAAAPIPVSPPVGPSDALTRAATHRLLAWMLERHLAAATDGDAGLDGLSMGAATEQSMS